MTVEQALQIADAEHRAGRLAQAEALFRQVLAVMPDHPGILHSLGMIALETNRLEEAERLIEQAIRLSPNKAVYHSNLGETHRRMARYDSAIASYRRALKLDSALAATRAFMAGAWIGAGRYDEAVLCCRQAIGQEERIPEAHNNLGIALTNLGRTEEALEAFRRAAALSPLEPELQVNLGLALVGARHWDEALACYRKAIALQPQHAEAHLNLAILLLLLGRYEKGWREYEWRGRVATPQNPPRPFAVPQWDGAAVNGATLLVHSDQGLGDALQFLRYVPLVRERAPGARVLIECQPELHSVVTRAEGLGAEVVESGKVPAFDLHVALLSLPFVLRTFEPLPMAAPYLTADPAQRMAWRERMRTGFSVGVAWTGNARHRDNRTRSIPVEQLAPLLAVENAHFYSLQFAAECPASVHPLEHVADFSDTAALVSELDLVISVDTAVAHLAGALGRPVWLLLPWVPDWRWGLDGAQTPWYPTMRLFRQTKRGNWQDVIDRVKRELETMDR